MATGKGVGMAPTTGLPSQEIERKKSPTDEVKFKARSVTEPFLLAMGLPCQLQLLKKS